ncbi:hypothetical protein FGG08_004206 [Glutinoglossum americanum]|uniref:Phosphatidic acid phosphatase type 2/haloperoxidase domain-containing protein n=1 Tax=Glutinoglossum americanum TaxID=1670608 RepID=A0A9P8KXA8_9PEZI|nr:hypothetical protein FGG08_004206 [Glutinoglossum americanum]
MHSAKDGSGYAATLQAQNNTIAPAAPPVNRPDAGLRGLDHYKSKLPRWRYVPRQALIPLVRWETPYLAWLQDTLRSPTLDSYFALTANLGTHTFFMCDGRIVHILASGVFFSGFIKDLLCLPRPLSPPLQRVTMSGSAALEYGFPSTHSTNAVSVAVYSILLLHSPETVFHPTTRLILELLAYAYASSIVIGRLYCGMHGFFDVIIGSLLGALIALVQWACADAIDRHLYSGDWAAPLIVALVVIVLVRIHPEPADDCPCFDDSVAFAGVMIGVELGHWHYAFSGWAWDYPVLGTVPFRLADIGWANSVLRIALGVITIFAWREVMKPTLLQSLPPIFRVLENLGLDLPRRFFVQASEYKKVPAHLKDDNVIPSVSELPSLITSIRHPRRRAVSIGPQSAADAYETLAYREQRRRESISSMGALTPTRDADHDQQDGKGGHLPPPTSSGQPDSFALSTMSQAPSSDTLFALPVSKADPNERKTETGVVSIPPTTQDFDMVSMIDGVNDRSEEEREEREMFLRLEKPRVRYDVEVVTKLIVYSGTAPPPTSVLFQPPKRSIRLTRTLIGIGWLAVEVNPILFEILGLGMGRQLA